MSTIRKYILSEMAGPFAFALGLLTFILFMRHMVFLFPKIAGKGVETSIIFELMGMSIPFIIALVVPMATLVAVITGYGRLSADNEIIAFNSLGVSLSRLMMPPLLASVILALGMIYFNDKILPEANHNYKNLVSDIAYLKPTLSLREGVIMDDIPGMGLLVNHLETDDGIPAGKLDPVKPFQQEDKAPQDKNEGANMFGIVINQDGDNGTKRTILADSGLIKMVPGTPDAMLTLYNGEIQEVDNQNQSRFQRMFFNRHQVRIPGVGGNFQRGRAVSFRSDRELNLKMLDDRIKEKNRQVDSLWIAAETLIDSLGTDDSTRTVLESIYGNNPINKIKKSDRPLSDIVGRFDSNRFRRLSDDPGVKLASIVREANYNLRRVSSLKVEYWKKFSIPFACIVFVIMGAPLGILIRRGGAGASIAISILVFIFYWAFLISGETLADRGRISPFWAMWLPNAVFLGIGIFLIVLRMIGFGAMSLMYMKLPKMIRWIFVKPEPDNDGAGK